MQLERGKVDRVETSDLTAEPRAAEAAAWRRADELDYIDPPRRPQAVCDELGYAASRADAVAMEDDALLAVCPEWWFVELDERADRAAIELGYRTVHDPLRPDADGVVELVHHAGYDDWRENDPTTHWQARRRG